MFEHLIPWTEVIAPVRVMYLPSVCHFDLISGRPLRLFYSVMARCHLILDVSDNPEDIVGLITICFDEKRMVITRRACVGNSEILYDSSLMDSFGEFSNVV